MLSTWIQDLRKISWVNWKPQMDILVVFVSWILVVGTLYTATVVVGQDVAGGMAYFGLYAVLGALVFGIGIPVWWQVVYRKRPLKSLGITTNHLAISIILQLIFAAFQLIGAFRGLELPSIGNLLPLVSLSLTIGFFEAIFWRGWVLLRLEESFGLLPAILLGSILYAVYHIGYAMPAEEISVLFFIGIMYAVAFRLTKSIFILWPIFQPMGQLVTLIRDQLSLPSLAAVGFIEVLVVMCIVIWLVSKYAWKKQTEKHRSIR